jgi:hypothetical protein
MIKQVKINKMKNFRLFALLALLLMMGGTMKAQQWEIDFGDASTYTWLSQGITDREQNAIFYGKSGYDKTDYYPYFIRVDQEGNHQSYVLGDEQFHNLNKPSMVQMEDGNFFMVGDVEKSAIYAIVLDSDFNVLSCKRYDKPEDAHSIVGGHLVLDHDGTVVLAGSCNYETSNGVWGRHYFCRFDNQADTIASRFYTPETQPGIIAYEYELDQLLLNPHGGFVLLGAGINGSTSILRFDSDFNYMGGNQLYANRRGFSDAYSDHWLPNDQLLVMGRVASFDDPYLESIGLAKLGIDGTMESIERFYCNRDTMLLTQNRCMAYYNDTTIYGAIDCKWYLEGPSITRICLVDTEMEVLGLKEITTEVSDYYTPGSILSTPDGGCIISVMEHYAFGENHVKGKIIKLSREDFNPIPTEVKELPHEAIKIYPNPTNDAVTIGGLEIAEVKVYNALGQLVKETKDNVLDLSDQESGTYIIKVITPSGTITKQIIKK